MSQQSRFSDFLAQDYRVATGRRDINGELDVLHEPLLRLATWQPRPLIGESVRPARGEKTQLACARNAADPDGWGAAVAAKCCTTGGKSVAKRYRFPFARL